MVCILMFNCSHHCWTSQLSHFNAESWIPKCRKPLSSHKPFQLAIHLEFIVQYFRFRKKSKYKRARRAGDENLIESTARVEWKRKPHEKKLRSRRTTFGCVWKGFLVSAKFNWLLLRKPPQGICLARLRFFYFEKFAKSFCLSIQ